MIHYKRDIFEFFLDDTILQRFCNEINNSKADVFILMAHKAAQLVQVLIDQEYIDDQIANKTFISNHALDFDCSFLHDKKISIIDDIVISGTSIASVVHKLLDFGVEEENIDIIALARDAKYQTMVFQNAKGDNVLHCDSVREDSVCIELSYFISRAFSYYGIPYDIDYPAYEPAEVIDGDLQFLFNQLLWRIETTTNSDQQAGDVDTYVLFPKPNVLHRLWEKIGVDLSGCAHMKIRAYMRRYPRGKVECSFIPMCLFDEITETNIDRLFERITSSTGMSDQYKAISYVAQMRYLEFWIAHQLYLVLIDEIHLELNRAPTEQSMKLLFGPNFSKAVGNSLNGTLPQDKRIDSIKAYDYLDIDLLKEFLSHDIGKEMVVNIAKTENLPVEEQSGWLNQIILAPFLWWYDTKEIATRKRVMSPVLHYIHDYNIIEKTLKRLRSGFSLNALQFLLNNDLTNEESRCFVSLFLDHAIDRGIIVPTILHDCSQKDGSEHYLCRAYRHGEDLPFSLEDECRLAYFLREICDRIPDVDATPTSDPLDQGFAEISFEKIIVLFYQMGIRQGGIFNHFLGFNNIKILKPFLSLHGAIRGVVDPKQLDNLGIEKTHFYSEKDAKGNRYITWLTYWAKDKEFTWNPNDNDGKKTSDILLNKRKIEKYLASNSRSCTSPLIKGQISDIASMIAVWYNTMIENGEKAKFKDEATALTSCSDKHIFASAIATELHYFDKFWSRQVRRAIESSEDCGEIEYYLNYEEFDRKNKANIIQGLNSGREKVEWFCSSEAKKTVNKVSKVLRDTACTNWNNLWLSVEEIHDIPSSQITTDINRYVHQTVSYLYFYSACNECLTYLPFWNAGKKPPHYEEYNEKYTSFSRGVADELVESWFDELNSVALLDTFEEKKKCFYNLVRRALDTSEVLVDNIEDELEKNQQGYLVKYRSALILEINAINPDCVENKLMHVWTEWREQCKQHEEWDETQLNIVSLMKKKENLSHRQYGFFYGIRKKYVASAGASPKSHNQNEFGEVLVSLYDMICREFNGFANSIRVIIIPQIPSGREFKHSTQRKIAENADRFRNTVVEPLQTQYDQNATQQLMFALSHSTEGNFSDRIDNSIWQHTKEYQNDNVCKGFSNFILHYNTPLRQITNAHERIVYSSVRIRCGSEYGMGLLINTKNRVVCVSCNHLVKKHIEEKENITAISDDNISFELIQTKEQCQPQTGSELILAEDELVILIPTRATRIPVTPSEIVSIDDLDKIPSYEEEYKCYGCINNKHRIWQNNLHFLGKAANGYCQMDDPEKRLQPGYSGGVVITNSQNPSIIGIHKGRIADCLNKESRYPLLIPSSIIKSKIHKWEEKSNV